MDEKRENKTNIHKNHRQRLKKKVKNFGLECLDYHEVLELLLTYTIPRKDTNPIAHELIENFGSFYNVIDANYFDLLAVDGIGSESALFINILSSFIEIYNKSKQEKQSQILNTTAACVKYFRTFYQITSNEYMLALGLSAGKKVVKSYRCKGSDDISVNFDSQNLFNHIKGKDVKSIVLFHIHPNGSVEPSKEDIVATQNLFNKCITNGVDFIDHIILNENEHYSFFHEGYLSKMKEKFISVFGVVDNYINKKKSK